MEARWAVVARVPQMAVREAVQSRISTNQAAAGVVPPLADDLLQLTLLFPEPRLTAPDHRSFQTWGGRWRWPGDASSL